MKLKKKKGQTVIEYLLVVVMIVGVGMGIYVAIRRYLPGPLRAVKASLEGDNDPRGRSAGSGQKSYNEYYNDVEFKSK
jgi:uncharacterized protein (UPF0333 family)